MTRQVILTNVAKHRGHRQSAFPAIVCKWDKFASNVKVVMYVTCVMRFHLSWNPVLMTFTQSKWFLAKPECTAGINHSAWTWAQLFQICPNQNASYNRAWSASWCCVGFSVCAQIYEICGHVLFSDFSFVVGYFPIFGIMEALLGPRLCCWVFSKRLVKLGLRKKTSDKPLNKYAGGCSMQCFLLESTAMRLPHLAWILVSLAGVQLCNVPKLHKLLCLVLAGRYLQRKSHCRSYWWHSQSNCKMEAMCLAFAVWSSGQNRQACFSCLWDLKLSL